MVNGCDLHLSAPVTGIDRLENGYRLHTPKGDFEARYIVNAAGLYCDKVHEMVGGHGFTVRGVRGEYYIMDKSQGGLVDHVIFQCPNQKGKGVLVAPPDRIPFAAQSDCVRVTVTFREVLQRDYLIFIVYKKAV